MDEPDLLTDDVPLDEGLPPTDDTPPAEDLPVTGRHRAAPATVRQVAQRAAVGAGTLAVVAALAVLTAFWTGLTGAPAQIQASTPPMVSDHGPPRHASRPGHAVDRDTHDRRRESVSVFRRPPGTCADSRTGAEAVPRTAGRPGTAPRGAAG